jgi:phosphocarrier protein
LDAQKSADLKMRGEIFAMAQKCRTGVKGVSIMNALKREVVIRNDSGLHLRPSAVFVQTANKHKGCEVFVARDGQRVNGKSIMGLVMLAAAKDTQLTIECSGEGAEAALDELCALVENKFGMET